MRAMDASRGLRASVLVLLAVGLVLALLVPGALWLRFVALDTTRYSDAVTPVAGQRAVQLEVADRLEVEINRRVDYEALAARVRPAAAGNPTAASAAVQDVVRRRLARFVRSSAFRPLWRDANERAHVQVAGLVTGARPADVDAGQVMLDIDLAPAASRVRADLRRRGNPRIAAAIPRDVDARVPVVATSTLDRARRVVDPLQDLALLIAACAVAALVGAVALAAPRRPAVALTAAVGVALVAGAWLAATAVGRGMALDAAEREDLPRSATGDVFDAMLAPLVDGLWIALAGVLLAALAALVSMAADRRRNRHRARAERRPYAPRTPPPLTRRG